MTDSKTVAVPMVGGRVAVEVETGARGRGVFVGIRLREGSERIITFGAGAAAARKLAAVLVMAADASDLAERTPILYTCRFCKEKGDVSWLGSHDCPEAPRNGS